MEKKQIIIVAIITILVIIILTVTSVKKDEFRESDMKEFENMVIPEQITKCLKEKKYSVDDPTPKQRAECQAVAQELWDEASTLNSDPE